MAEEEKEPAIVTDGGAKPEGEKKEFDSNSFISSEVEGKTDDPPGGGGGEGGGAGGGGGDDDDPEKKETPDAEETIWNDEDLKFEDEEEQDLDENGKPKPVETDPEKIRAAAEEKARKEKEAAEQNPVFNPEEFKELGIEAKDTNELKAKIKAVIDENETLKSGTYRNEKLDFWRKTLSLDDKELVKKELKLQGFEGQELEDAVTTYETNGTLAIEAKKIRNSLTNAIARETTAEKQRIAQSESARHQNKVEAQKLLQDHLNKSDKILGFNYGKNEQETAKRKQDHFRYIDSGKFISELFDSPEALSDAAWFHRNKKTITNALINKGAQTAKQEFLNDIGNPTKVNSDSREKPPGEQGEKDFDSKKFVTG